MQRAAMRRADRRATWHMGKRSMETKRMERIYSRTFDRTFTSGIPLRRCQTVDFQILAGYRKKNGVGFSGDLFAG